MCVCVCVCVFQVMKGYLDNVEATKNTITPEGWLHSGDIAYYGDTNHVYIVDRLKELIKVKGFQVPTMALSTYLSVSWSSIVPTIVERLVFLPESAHK